MSLLDVFERHKYDISIVNNSKTWFRQQVTLLNKERINTKAFHRSSGTVVNRIVPGNLYMFFYDPKYKETLEFYDRFPLVFPFEKYREGFLGLNMHYLSYKLRIVLLENLLKFKNTKTLDENTRLRYSWNIIKGMTRSKLAEQCVKHYLFDHVQSQIKRIDATDWTTAMMLPVESFAKTNKTGVWKNTGGI
jgi:hypothetical protein